MRSSARSASTTSRSACGDCFRQVLVAATWTWPKRTRVSVLCRRNGVSGHVLVAPTWTCPERTMRTIQDPAAEFVPAAQRVFGDVRVLDGSRSLLVGETKLSLEAGERELWLIQMHGALEHRLSM